MRFKSRLTISTLLLGMVAASVVAPIHLRAEQQQPERDLYIKSANPDGSLNCAKWCGITEPCC